MKHLLSILIFMALCGTGRAQINVCDDFLLSAQQFTELLNADKNTSNDMLKPCFKVVELDKDERMPSGQKVTTNIYKRTYKQADGQTHKDLVKIQSNGDVIFTSTCEQTYKHYKDELIKYGFKFIHDGGDGQEVYYFRTTITLKCVVRTNDKGVTEYRMVMTP
jgi:hypothetical protein